MGERFHLSQHIGFDQPEMEVATAQVAGDAAPHLAIAKQHGFADVEGAVEGARQRLGGVDHAQTNLDILGLLEGTACHRHHRGRQHLLLIALMAVLGHLHHPEETGAEVLAQNHLGFGEVTADIEDQQPLVGGHQRCNLLDEAVGIIGPVPVEGQHRIVLGYPLQGRAVYRFRFGQNGADPPNPGKRFDKTGAIGKQVSDQQNTETVDTSLSGEMAKKQMLRSLTAQLWPPYMPQSRQTEPGAAGFCVCPNKMKILFI